MENKCPLVSVIIPCYNSESLLPKLLDSLLIQDWKNIEIIAINDGSTDSTLIVLENYLDKFKKKGFAYYVYSQDNQGQAPTINNALKYISGDYLVWPDADDWYEDSSCIRLLVHALEVNKQYSCSRLWVNYVDEATGKKEKIVPSDPHKELLFYDFYYWTSNIWAPAGSHMIRVTIDLKEKGIYANKNGGQNYQLLLPSLAAGPCYSVKSHLYNILVRKGSHSRGTYGTYNKEIIRWNDSISLINATIKNIDCISDNLKDDLMKETLCRYAKIKAQTSIQYRHLFNYIMYMAEYLCLKCFVKYKELDKNNIKLG